MTEKLNSETLFNGLLETGHEGKLVFDGEFEKSIGKVKIKGNEASLVFEKPIRVELEQKTDESSINEMFEEDNLEILLESIEVGVW